jgi:hypothetical protein
MSSSIWDQEIPEKKKRAPERFLALYDSETWGSIAKVIDGEVKPLKNFVGRYSISSNGYVFNSHGVRLRPHRRTRDGTRKYGPVYVKLWDGTRSWREDVARLVWSSFREELTVAQGLIFLDNDVENCALSNLRLLGVRDSVIQ